MSPILFTRNLVAIFALPSATLAQIEPARQAVEERYATLDEVMVERRNSLPIMTPPSAADIRLRFSARWMDSIYGCFRYGDEHAKFPAALRPLPGDITPLPTGLSARVAFLNGSTGEGGPHVVQSCADGPSPPLPPSSAAIRS